MMDEHEIAAAAAELSAARARGEYFPRAWFDRLELDDETLLENLRAVQRGRAHADPREMG